MPIDDILDESMVADVRAAFAAVAGGIVPLAGDADRLVRAGRRRLYRRRAITTAAMMAASALVGAGTTTLTTASRYLHSAAGVPSPAASPAFEQGPYADLYRRPARGDLAGDAAYTAKVIATWNASHGRAGSSLESGIFDDLRGAPHVVWAGTTPAGPAAVVAQPAWWAQRGPHKKSDEIMVTLVGLVGVDEQGDPKVIADDYEPINAWFVDPSLTTMVILDLGYPVSYSAGWTYRSDGTRYLKWVPARFHDGAAVIPMAHDVDVCAVQLKVAPTDVLPITIAGSQDWNTYCQRKGVTATASSIPRS